MSCFSKNRWELGLHTSGTSSTFEGVGSPGKSSKEEKSATDSSPNPMSTASVDLAMIIKYTKLFIDNNFVDSAATRHGLLEVKNPFNGSVLALVRIKLSLFLSKAYFYFSNDLYRSPLPMQ